MSHMRMNRVLATIAGFIVLAGLSIVTVGHDAALALISREVTVEPEPQATPEPTWTWADAILDATNMLDDVQLNVGAKEIPYTEQRFSLRNGTISVTDKTLSDPERQIALVLLNTKTGELVRVDVTQRGGELITPPEWPISIVPRASGIIWNAWNTMYHAPEPYVVVMNLWPEPKGSGAARTIDYTLYTPYSAGLHNAETIGLGTQRDMGNVTQALATLRTRGVYSRAFPGVLLADVAALKPEFFERLPLIEHTDYGEFVLNPQQALERVLVIIGTNGQRAFAYTGSGAGARGLYQYTEPTWNTIRDFYAAARLPVYGDGVRDPLASAMAAILLYDNNLKLLIEKFGQGIVNDPHLEEYLAAAYNGRPAHVVDSLKAVFKQYPNGTDDWGVYLKDETDQYIAKIREIKRLGYIGSTASQKRARKESEPYEHFVASRQYKNPQGEGIFV